MQYRRSMSIFMTFLAIANCVLGITELSEPVAKNAQTHQTVLKLTQSIHDKLEHEVLHSRTFSKSEDNANFYIGQGALLYKLGMTKSSSQCHEFTKKIHLLNSTVELLAKYSHSANYSITHIHLTAMHRCDSQQKITFEVHNISQSTYLYYETTNNSRCYDAKELTIPIHSIPSSVPFLYSELNSLSSTTWEVENLFVRNTRRVCFLQDKTGPHLKINLQRSQPNMQTIQLKLFQTNNQSEIKQRYKRQLFSNLHNPVFAQSPYITTLEEEVDIGHEVIRVLATDSDEGGAGDVRYSLHADRDQRSLNIFEINSMTGSVTTKSRVDREDIDVHGFTVKATDRGSPANSAEVSLTINILDINDHDPEFELPSYNVSVSEVESVSFVIVRVRADDLDIGANKLLVYSILNSASNSDLAIESATGAISIAHKLDREKKSHYNVVVQAQDQGLDVSARRSSTVTANIYVLDHNDNTPVFNQTEYIFTVKEDVDLSIGPVAIGFVSATDEDSGDNGRIRYSITFGNFPRVFDIVANTGQVTVITPLDRDVSGGQEYNLRIKASDRGVSAQSSNTNVKVIVEDVNDNAPSFRYSSYTYSMYENEAAGTTIATMTASDPDSGINKQLSYDIINGDTLPITINPQSGILTNAEVLDREDIPRYQFVVRVADGGTPQQSATAQVTLTLLDKNDNSPEFTHPVYSKAISEDTPVNQEVTIVTAVDPDENDVLIYTINSGDPFEDFVITKEQTFGVMRVNHDLSYDRRKFYTMTVEATDTDGQSAECIVNVTVQDKNSARPVFRQLEYSFDVSEAEGDGFPVGKVQADDSDVENNGLVSYFFIPTDVVLPFSIDSLTGEIRVNNTLDRDNPATQEFTIDVMAQDHGLPVLQSLNPAIVHISIRDVNDNAPVFAEASYSATVSEDAAVHKLVTQISATDIDQQGSANSRITYTFEGGNDGNGSFYIEHSTGYIRVNRPLDRETVSQYDLIAYARDMPVEGALSTAVSITVIVEDINDSDPQFESVPVIRRILENKSPNSIVDPPIYATDADEGENAVITFALVGGDTDAFELFDRGDGSFILKTKIDMDYESLRKNFTLEVKASSQHRISKGTVVIKLQDVNDNAPQLQDFSIVVNSYVNHFPSGPIGRIPAFDRDELDRDRLEYSITSGNEGNLLILDRSTGILTLNPLLESDSPTNATFQVQASDFLNTANATCYLQVRQLNREMLKNSVTLMLDNMTPQSFMTSVYNYTLQALSHVLQLMPSNIYITDIQGEDDFSDPSRRPILNMSFAAMEVVNHETHYLSQEYIKEKIYLRLDLLKNLSAVSILPFDDKLCVLEPCELYKKCSWEQELDDSASLNFITSSTMLFRPIRTKDDYSCECPTGVVGMDVAYQCDTEINLCYSGPCQNGGTCVQTEGSFICQCTEKYAGKLCQYDMVESKYTADTCPQDICLGGGKCIDSIQGGFACWKGTSRCEKSDVQTKFCGLRSANFKPGSYLMYPAIISRHRLSISISFATRDKNGLLLYNGRYNSNNDFIALELVNHDVRFSMSLGDTVYNVSVGTEYGLNDGEWHTVRFEYSKWSGILVVDDCDTGLSISNPELFNKRCAAKLPDILTTRCSSAQGFCFFDLTGPMLIGGLPGYLDMGRIENKDFTGCIRDVYLNHKFIDFNAAVIKNTVQDGCSLKRNYCTNSTCEHQGTCTNSWTTHRCDCKPGYGGHTCSDNIDRAYTFYGIGYLRYDKGLQQVPPGRPWYNSFSFKTTVDDVLLLRVRLEQSKIVEYRLENGYVTFTYGLFKHQFDDIKFNDDKWHNFEMRLLKNRNQEGFVLFVLDYKEKQVSRSLDDSLYGLQVQSVWAGGDGSSNTSHPGFSGCMKDIRVGDSPSIQLHDPERPNVNDGCGTFTSCSIMCPSATSICKVGWEESTCLCNKGYIGENCQSACKYNPCQNNGQCQLDSTSDLGYTCTCQDKYQGTHCEESLEQVCPTSWWGTPVCGPCNCDAELNFDSRCNKTTGQCYCEFGHYKPRDSRSCLPCNCYRTGSTEQSCDQSTGQCKCHVGVIGQRCDECSNPFAEVTNTGCSVQYNKCPKKFYKGVWWSRTSYGSTAIEPCPAGSTGNATRYCVDNVQGWSEPSLEGCVSLSFTARCEYITDACTSSLKEKLDKLEAVLQSNRSAYVRPANSPAYYTTARDSMEHLKNATQSTPNLYTKDLSIAYRIIKEVIAREKTMKSLNLTHKRSSTFPGNLVSVVSSIMEPHLAPRWKSLHKSQSMLNLSQLITDMDAYLSNLADNMATVFQSGGLEPLEIVTPNVVFGLDTVNRNDISIPKYNSIVPNEAKFDKVTSVHLPPGLFVASPVVGLKNKAVAGFIMYRTLGEVLVQSSTGSIYADSVRQSENVDLSFNSPVLSLVLQQGSTRPNLKGNSLKFRYLLRQQDQTTNPQCVFLHSGNWSTDGCTMVGEGVDEVHGRYIECACDHLSTFSLITDIKLNTAHLSARVEVHMYIAVSIALFCLVFTLLVFICLKDLKSDYVYIMINLLMNLCMALILFIAGVDKWYAPAACTVVSVGLHFFTLTTFAWLFVIGLHLYRVLTEKRNIDREAMMIYFVAGYVLPGIITGLSVGLRPAQFGNERICWLLLEDSMVWSLASPALLCSLSNLILLAMSSWHTCNVEGSTKDFEKFRCAVRISVLATPAILCTWLFAFLSTNQEQGGTNPYGIIFSVCACLLGFYMLMTHVLFNQVGRRELRRRWQQIQGRGQLEEESDLSHSPKPKFGEYINNSSLGGGLTQMTLAAGSESSTTSFTQSSSRHHDLLGYLKAPNSSTSSDMMSSRRRVTTTDQSSDSDSDDVGRDKGVELASSHSSDDEDPVLPTRSDHVEPMTTKPPLSRHTPVSPLMDPEMSLNRQPFSTPMVGNELGMAPPPPYFLSPPTGWSGRLSESTASTRGSDRTGTTSQPVSIAQIEILPADVQINQQNNPFDGTIQTSTGPRAVIKALDDDDNETQV